MKKNNRSNLLQVALGAGVCISLTGVQPAMAAQSNAMSSVSIQQDDAKAEKAEKKAVPTKQISGYIYDATTKAPMAGVRVQALNNPMFTAMTQEDGKYTIKVPTYVQTLFVSVPEYNSVQLAVKGAENQNVNLYSSKFAGGFENATQITASSKVTIDNSTSLTIDDDIQRQLEGDIRTVERTAVSGQGVMMLVRGLNSLNINAQPLVIIDGVIMDMQQDRTSIHEGFFNNILAGIDVEDIETVEVLKNATALYGAKGANGVLLINTKRGKSMATKINASVFAGIETMPTMPRMMDGNSYRSYVSDIAGKTEHGQKHMTAANSSAFFNENPEYYWYPMYHNNTDWTDGLYHNAISQNYKVGVQGGDDIAMYNLSLGYAAADATSKGSDMNRLNIRFNTDINLIKNLKTQLDIYYSRTAYNILDNGWAESKADGNITSPNVLGLIQSPCINKYGYETGVDGKLFLSDVYAGKYIDSDNYPFDFGNNYIKNSALINPNWILSNGDGVNKNHQELTMFAINVKPEYQINKNLKISNRFSYNLTRHSEKYYLPEAGTPKYTLSGLGDVTSIIRTLFGKENSVNEDLRIDWNKQLGAHYLNVFGGFRMTSFSFTDNWSLGYNSGNDKMPNMSYSRDYKSWGGNDESWKNLAYYVNADYNYANRYFVQGTATMETSSRFGKDGDQGIGLCGVRWGIFPSLQAAWVISSEPWFNTKGGINYLKLSLGYDASGNDNINASASRTYFKSATYIRKATGLVLANIENPDLQWETTHKFNLGLQASMLDNRLGMNLNLYYHRTNNLLTQKSISYLTGLDTYWCNEGSLENRGVEFSANAILLNTKDWKWQLGASVGHYKNEIKSLPEGNVVNNIYGAEVLTKVGEAAGVFYGYKTAGVFADDAAANSAYTDADGQSSALKYKTGLTGDKAYRYFQAGDVHFVDQDGNGIIDEKDKTIIGNPNPDIYGNITSSLSYKKFTLTANFKYSLGNDIYNYQRSQLEAGNNFYNQTTAMQNRWTYQGQVTDVPRACPVESEEWVNNERFSDRWIEDGSYLKLKTLRLTYELPLSLSWLQGVTVYGEAVNLFTISKYLGSDPETSTGNNVLYQGIDTGMLRHNRGFNVGVKLNL